eukprot:5951514-Pleurochrysis_carterae.AAC.1
MAFFYAPPLVVLSCSPSTVATPALPSPVSGGCDGSRVFLAQRPFGITAALLSAVSILETQCFTPVLFQFLGLLLSISKHFSTCDSPF